MIIDQTYLNILTGEAKASPRLRMNWDLRNSPSDLSQRMLNAIEPGSIIPIHRHCKSSETVVVLRGHLREYFYDSDGNQTGVYDLMPCGNILALNIPLGQWHSAEALKSGTVIIEMKDGKYEPLCEDDILL